MNFFLKALVFCTLIWCNSTIAQLSNCSVYPLPNEHSISNRPCWGNIDWLSRHEHESAPEQCNYYNGYITMFEDGFDGTSINTNKWNFTADDNWYNNDNATNKQLFTENNPANYMVANGVLTMKANYVGNKSFSPDIYDSNNGCKIVKGNPIIYFYESGQINTFKLFPTGKYEVRCKAHFMSSQQNDVNMAPLWLRMPPLDNEFIGNEIDIELVSEASSSATRNNSLLWSFHGSPPFKAGSLKRCQDSKRNYCISKSLYDDWHTFVIEWDSHKIKWSVDGTHFRSIYRTYNLAGIAINECNGPAVAGYKRRNDMFPTFTNMQMFSDIGLNRTTGAQSYIKEIDFIRASKKIDCSQIIQISEYNPFRSNTLPAQYGSGVQTPQVLTGGVITVAGNGNKVNVARDKGAWWYPAHLDLYASSSITLLPGFICDPSTNFHTTSCVADIKGQNSSDNSVKFGDGFIAQAVPCPTTGGGNRVGDTDEEDNIALSTKKLSKEEIFEMDFYEAKANEFANGDEKKQEEILAGADDIIIENPNLEVYPNPTKEGQAIYFVCTIPQDGEVELTITDLSGHKITTVESAYKRAAIYSITWKNTELAPGSYIAHLKSKGYSTSQTIVII